VAAAVAKAKGAEGAAALAALAAAEDAAAAAAAAEVRLEGADLLHGTAVKAGGALSPGPPPAGPEHEAEEEEEDDDEAVPPPPPPPPAAASTIGSGRGEGNVPWRLVFRAAGAADVASITELQTADSNALLRELAAKLLPAEPELQVGAAAALGRPAGRSLLPRRCWPESRPRRAHAAGRRAATHTRARPRCSPTTTRRSCRPWMQSCCWSAPPRG
jgi:hypothetical protein